MNILIVTQYFYPENFRINELAKELILRGHTISVLTGIPNYPSGKTFEDYLQSPKDYDNYEGVKIYRIPIIVRGSSNLQLILNYLSFIISGFFWGPWVLRGKKFDAIFVYQPSPITVGLPAILLGKIKHAPVILWVLDLWPDTLRALNVVRSPLFLNLIGALVKYIYNRTTLILAQSYSFIYSISNYCDNKSKIRYFPNWADEIFFNPNLLPAPEIPKIQGAFNVLFTGNIGEAQDFPVVLDAIDLLKHKVNVRLLIVGDGRKLKWLQNEVICRNLQQHVLLLGRYPAERMPSFYLHANALLISLKKHPVFSMTIPAKLQSYLMARVPIIGMIDGESAKVILEANAGIVCEASNPFSLSLAIIDLAKMPESKRNIFAENGQSYAYQNFKRSSLITKLELFISEAIMLKQNKRKLVI